MPNLTATTDTSVLRITWIGHSTTLLELDGTRLLTDPVLRSRVAHLRRTTRTVDPASYAAIDAVLVSHVHHDHLDLSSLARIGSGCRIVVPTGAGDLLRRRGFAHVEEVAAGDELRVGSVRVAATRAEHPARRGLTGGTVPAVGYLVSACTRVYFAGDTDLFDGMADLAPELDVALLPVAGWGFRVPAGHLNPRTAALALGLLRPRIAIPIHWGTFRPIGFGRDPAHLRGPAESFVRLAGELAPDVDVRLLSPGAHLELELSSGGSAFPTKAMRP